MNHAMKMILASSSPRRKALLARLDIDFSVQSVDIDETRKPDETPTDYITRMVSQKAEGFLSDYCSKKQQDQPEQEKQSLLVLTADTIGVLANGKDVLLKPRNQADAYAMWQKMSNTFHYVWTAVQASLIDASGNLYWHSSILHSTKVEFIELTPADMDAYWQTGEPLDKAGAYAIQGKAAAWVKSIEGSYTNVVGLPLAQTKQLLDTANTYCK